MFGKVFDLSDELEQAKVNKADHKLIKGLETKLIQTKAKRPVCIRRS
jgi:hemerythrin superfamily protein